MEHERMEWETKTNKKSLTYEFAPIRPLIVTKIAFTLGTILTKLGNKYFSHIISYILGSLNSNY